MSVQFALNLIDGTSAPALRAASAMASVEQRLRALQKAMGVDVGKTLQGADSALRRVGSGVSVSAGNAREFGAAMQQGLSKASSALSGLGAAMAVVAPLGLVAGGLMAAGATYAGQMSRFKEDMLFSFSAITGSQQKAGEVMTMADELARAMGVKTTDVTTSIRELMASGFDVGQTKAIVAAQFDIKAINPAADVSGLNKALAKMQGARKFSMEVAESILGAGVDDSKFYAILQNVTGSKNRDDLFKKISAGKVTDQQGLSAMLQSVQQSSGGGPLGSAAMGKAQSTVGGSVTNMIGMLERLFLAINTSGLGQSLAKIINTAANLFDPAQPSGQQFLGLLQQAVGLAERMFKNVSPADIIAAFNAVVEAGGIALSFIEPLVQGFASGFGEAVGAVRMIAQEFGIGQGPTTSMGNALKLVGTALGWVAVGVGVAVGGIAWMTAKIAGIATFLWGASVSIGIAVIEGITGGLDSAKAGLVSRLKTLAELLPDTVRKLLGIKSPSLVFADIGVNTMRGFEVGMQRGPNPSAVMTKMFDVPLDAVESPNVSGPKAADVGAGMARGGQNIQISFGNIEVHAGDNPQAVAAEVSTAIRREVTSLFERMVIETGAGAIA
jgi:hypothetical protein